MGGWVGGVCRCGIASSTNSRIIVMTCSEIFNSLTHSLTHTHTNTHTHAHTHTHNMHAHTYTHQSCSLRKCCVNGVKCVEY